MSVKTELVKILESNRACDLSGQELAEQLGVSRAAIWKAVNALRQEGYQIEAANNRGYRLSGGTDRLSEAGIRLWLDDSCPVNRLLVFDTVDSTNTYLKQYALSGGQDGDVAVANQQTAGRGRLGRSFCSPADSGVYMSFLLKRQLPLADAAFLTVIAGVAVCRAIEACTGQQPGIKWVNDVFLNGKKICGILTEAVSDCETGMAESIVVGIGINVKTKPGQFPPEVRKVAASLNQGQLQRNRLAAEVMQAFFALLDNWDKTEVLEAYKKRSILIGKTVSYVKNGQTFIGTAADVNENGNLIVILKDGARDVLQSGEVSIGSGNFTCV